MIDHLHLKSAALAILLSLAPVASQAQQSGDDAASAPGQQALVEAVRLLAAPPDVERQARAISLLQAAVEAGNPQAMFALASLHENGREVDQDQTRARTLYRNAAALGHDKSRNALAMMLLQDAGGAGDAEAVTLLQQAADNGLAVAKTNLGVLYLEGRGTARQPEKGAGLIREAAQAGLPMAQHNYARLLETGIAVQADPVEALKWYAQAAENGVPEAQYNLALMQARGAGMQADPVDAMKWLMIASVTSSGELKRQVDDAISKVAATLEAPQVAEAGERANLWLVRNRLQVSRTGG